MVDNSQIFVKDMSKPDEPAITLQQVIDDDGFLDPITVTDQMAMMHDIITALNEELTVVSAKVKVLEDKIKNTTTTTTTTEE